MSGPRHLELHIRAELAGTSGSQVALSRDGRRWAAADGQRLHVGTEHVLLDTLVADPEMPNGELSFTDDANIVRWGASTAALTDDGRTGRWLPVRRELLDALTAAMPTGAGVDITASVGDDEVAIIAGCSRQPRRLHSPGVPSVGRVVAVSSAGTKILWQGQGLDAPSLLSLSHGLVAAGGGRLTVIELETGAVLLDDGKPHGNGSVNAMAWGPGNRLYTAGADGCVNEWSVPGGQVATFQCVQEPLRGIAVDGTGTLVAVTGWDDALHIFDGALPSHAALATLSLPAHGEAVAFAADGASVLVSTGGAHGALRWVGIVGR